MAGAALFAACSSRTVLTDLVEARRLAASMHVAFATAAETSSRAVMGRSDDESRAAAIEAVKARDAVERDLAALRPLLQRLRYAEEVRLLETFMAQFADYKRLDDELLPLAAENSNLRAQQLSFGAARDAAAAVRQAVGDSPAAARAYIGTLEILALQAPHIAEATDEAMTRMEAEMARSEATVRQALAQLKSGVPASQVNAATAAFDRFMSINAEILTLSRRNSNVRSLALALGQRRETTALCEATLQALERTLAAHSLGGTR
jgi:negative regulator of replication initiation